MAVIYGWDAKIVSIGKHNIASMLVKINYTTPPIDFYLMVKAGNTVLKTNPIRDMQPPAIVQVPVQVTSPSEGITVELHQLEGGRDKLIGVKRLGVSEIRKPTAPIQKPEEKKSSLPLMVAGVAVLYELLKGG